MEIRVLSEDTSISNAFRHEHGLSFYIETKAHKILFDTGASGLFLENAKKLSISIADVDTAVISHGHYDHGGGLHAFLAANRKAKIYIDKNAFERHYSKKNDVITEIGIDKALSENDRIVKTDGLYPLDAGLILFSTVTGREFPSSCNASLFAEKKDAIVPDPFDHEQNLLISEGNNTILIAGCAHRGIVNIMRSAAEFLGKQPTYVIGGFHLYNHSQRTSENPAAVIQLGEALKDTGSFFYTGHCTGTASFQVLKKVMGCQISHFSTGSVVRIE